MVKVKEDGHQVDDEPSDGHVGGEVNKNGEKFKSQVVSMEPYKEKSRWLRR